MQRSENWGQDGGKLGKAGIKSERALQCIWKEKRKDHILCLGTGGAGRPGSPVEWHALVPRQIGQNVPTCFGCLESSGEPSRHLLFLLEHSSPFPSRAALYTYSDTLMVKERSWVMRSSFVHRTCHKWKCS